MSGFDQYSLLDEVAVAVYTTDAAGCITYFNEAAVALWGRRPQLGEEWCGSLRLFSVDGRPMAHGECPMAMTLREERPVRGLEAILERPDGSRVRFEPLPTPLRDGAGTLVGAVNVLLDVTLRRHAEAQLERTAEALRASNAVKDEFLGLMSHELRTPATTIFGDASLLAAHDETLSASDRRALILDIAAESARLRGVIENLLALSRLGTADPMDREPQVLGRLLGAAIQRFRGRAADRTVDCRVPAGLLVDADGTALELVLENLLTNADKYSPPGAPVEVIAESDGDMAHVMVRDRGIGITDEALAKVFEPFYRAEAAQQTAGGLGIGLTVCKRLVEHQGGTISARRRTGGGTEMRFTVPLCESEITG